MRSCAQHRPGPTIWKPFTASATDQRFTLCAVCQSSPEPATNFTYLSLKSELRDSRLKLPDTAEDKRNRGEKISRIPNICGPSYSFVTWELSETRNFTQRRLHSKV